jgi:hypothetical protein
MPYEQQIAKGVALLDEKMPGWWKRIDLDHLNMAVCETYFRGDCGCVLAQLDYDDEDGRDRGDYPRLAKALGLDTTFRVRNPAPNHAEHYGFTLPLDQMDAATSAASDDLDEADAMESLFEPLTAEWKATILRLRSERA